MGAINRSPWKRHPPLCHPERSRGICGSTDLSWECFPSTTQAVVSAHRIFHEAVGREPLQPDGGPLWYGSDGVAQAGIAVVHDPVQEARNLLRAGASLLVVGRSRQCCFKRSAVG